MKYIVNVDWKDGRKEEFSYDTLEEQTAKVKELLAQGGYSFLFKYTR